MTRSGRRSSSSSSRSTRRAGRPGAAVPAGLFAPDGYGLYDAAGNVLEWVWDWGSEAQACRWAFDGARNPRGPDAQEVRPAPLRRRGRRGAGARRPGRRAYPLGATEGEETDAQVHRPA
ncbi:MAG: SUMF1/EgtB/PvdO family nonheme iron enzyme [Candidatus Aminicenantes bacterium]|nr:SUMF1/EgtB/PvdO family nonheme iron enzyme [Candidatus Aminicenantes bacterium]